MRPTWTPECLDAVEDQFDDAVWDWQRERKDYLSLSVFDPSYSFDCCICQGNQTFVAQLDNSKLDDRVIEIDAGLCVNCDFGLDLKAKLLANELFKHELEKSRDAIIEGGR